MINPINPHYSIENTPTVFDEEATTVLELVGRTAAKVNEVVAAQNQLGQDTENRLQQQDQAIDKMNNVTMPGKVTAEVQRKIDSGEFNRAIDEYAGNLETRVDNLLSAVPDGPTKMDLEVVDTRTDIFGGVAYTAGGAVRYQASKLHEMVSPLADYQLEKVAVSVSPGYFDDQNAEYRPNPEGQNHHCARLAVNPGETYLIHTRYGMDIQDAAVINEDDVCIRLYNRNPGAIVSNNYDKPIHIPDHGVELLINYVSGDDIGVYKVTGYNLQLGSVWDTLSGMFDALKSDAPVLGAEVSVPVVTASFLDNGVPTKVQNGDTTYRTATLSVKPGEIYFLDTSAKHINNYYFSIFDIHGNMVAGMEYTSEKGSPHRGVVMVPPGGFVMHVSGLNSDPAVYRVNGFRSAGGIGGLKWYCIGDSLTEKNLRTTKNYHDYVAAASGVQVVNHGVSGTGYMRGEDKAFHNRITADMANADVITIFGSGNDLVHINVLGSPTDTGTNTICGCINTTIDNIYAVAPTVQLGIVAPTPWVGNEPADNGTMTRYCEALEAICKRRGIPYLDLFHCSGLRPNSAEFRQLAYSKDEGNGVHPDETGHKMISGHFLKFLESLVSTY